MKKNKHIVCYSGGHSSALVAIEVVKLFGKENVILLNHNINPRYEDADIKRFKKEVAEYLVLDNLCKHKRLKMKMIFQINLKCEERKLCKSS